MMTRLEMLFYLAFLFLVWGLYVNIRDLFTETGTYEYFLQEEQERQLRRAARHAHWKKLKTRVSSIVPKLRKTAASIAAILTGG